MGGYQLIRNVLHYTGDGWVSAVLSNAEVRLFKQNKLNVLDLDWR